MYVYVWTHIEITYYTLLAWTVERSFALSAFKIKHLEYTFFDSRHFEKDIFEGVQIFSGHFAN
jgi:hypothetical protein